MRIKNQETRLIETRLKRQETRQRQESRSNSQEIKFNIKKLRLKKQNSRPIMR